MIIHETKSDLAGKTVKIKKNVKHFQFPDFGGADIVIEDWLDRVMGQSWMYCDGNPACMVYALRTVSKKNIPMDNDVLYGHTKNGLGHLVHMTEIETNGQV
jgi:hypothetical protein